MATILLAAAGASIGAGFGGTVLGLSGAVIGRAVGATLGRVIDQKLLGSGSKAVETGRVDRMRIQTAGEGTPIPRIWGQLMRNLAHPALADLRAECAALLPAPTVENLSKIEAQCGINPFP